MVGYRLGYPRLCRPCFQMFVDVGVVGQAAEHKPVRLPFLPFPAFRQPPAGLHTQRDMHGLLALVHHHRQQPPVPVLGNVAPFELPHVAQPQTAVAGEKISTFDVLPFAGCRYQSLHLVIVRYSLFPLFVFARSWRERRSIGLDGMTPSRTAALSAVIKVHWRLNTVFDLRGWPLAVL